jgi:hypothetical protein
MTPLRRRMTEDMEIRNLSPNTQLAYLQQVSSFAKRVVPSFTVGTTPTSDFVSHLK